VEGGQLLAIGPLTRGVRYSMRLAKLHCLVIATVARSVRLVVVCNCVVALVHCRNDFDTLIT
jgi:hypothetical protein